MGNLYFLKIKPKGKNSVEPVGFEPTSINTCVVMSNPESPRLGFLLFLQEKQKKNEDQNSII